MSGRKSGRDPIRDVASWVVDHVQVEVNFEGVPLIVVGDPAVLAGARMSFDINRPWQWLEGAGGLALAIQGPDDGDAPWVWVLGSDDGPLSSIEVSPRLETTTERIDRKSIGSIAMPSGRLVVGSPTAVLAAGPDIDTPDEQAAQFRRIENAGDLIRDGYIVIVRAPYGEACSVTVDPSANPDRILGLSVALPTPSWLPPAAPIIQPD